MSIRFLSALLLVLSGVTVWSEEVIDIGEVTSTRYKVYLEFEPKNPQPNEEFSLYVVGEFPTPGYSITDKSIAILESLPEQLHIHLTVEESEDPVAQVITPFRELVGSVSLSEGIHPFRISVNQIVVADGNIAVGDLPDPPDQPNTKNPLMDAMIVVSPQNPEPGETFTVYLTGSLPSPGYEITNKELLIMESYPEQLMVQVTIKPLEGEWIQVVTPIRETIGTAALGAGEHPLTAAINDDFFYKAILQIGEVEIPEPELPPRNYTINVTSEPENPQPGEPFSVYVYGEFSSSGFTFINKELLATDSIPEHLSVNVEIQAPEGPVDTVIVPFRELVGTTVLSEGVHSLHATVNGESFQNGVLLVGDVTDLTYVRFTRTGGFAGFQQELMLYTTAMMTVQTDFPRPSGTNVVQLPEETFTLVQQHVEAIDFANTLKTYEPDYTIADGFNYTLTVGDHPEITIGQGADLPQELEQTIRILEQLLDGKVQRDDLDVESYTPVASWQMY